MWKQMKISHSNTQILETYLKFSVLLDRLFELIFRNSDRRKLIIVHIANLPGSSFCFGGCTSTRCRWCSAECLSWRRPAFHILSYHYVKFLYSCDFLIAEMCLHLTTQTSFAFIVAVLQILYSITS